MYETSSMCREVMRTANTFLSLGSAAEPLLHVPFVFRFPSCSELLLASRKQRLGFESGVSTSVLFFVFTRAQKPFGALCFLTSEYPAWQCAPGLAELPMLSPMPLLVKAPYEAPYQLPSSRKVAAPCAHPESLIGALVKSQHFNKVQSLRCTRS